MHWGGVSVQGRREKVGRAVGVGGEHGLPGGAEEDAAEDYYASVS